MVLMTEAVVEIAVVEVAVLVVEVAFIDGEAMVVVIVA